MAAPGHGGAGPVDQHLDRLGRPARSTARISSGVRTGITCGLEGDGDGFGHEAGVGERHVQRGRRRAAAASVGGAAVSDKRRGARTAR